MDNTADATSRGRFLATRVDEKTYTPYSAAEKKKERRLHSLLMPQREKNKQREEEKRGGEAGRAHSLLSEEQPKDVGGGLRKRGEKNHAPGEGGVGPNIVEYPTSKEQPSLATLATWKLGDLTGKTKGKNKGESRKRQEIEYSRGCRE